MWLIFTLLAVASTTVLATLMKLFLVRSESPRAFSAVFNIFGAFVAVTLTLFMGGISTNIDLKTFILLVCSGVGYGVFQRYQFTVRKHVQASVLQTFIAPTGIAGYLLAIVWLHEPLTYQRVVGYALILTATFFVIKKPKAAKIEKSVYALLVLIIGVALSISGTIDRQVSPHFSVISYTAIIWIFQALGTVLPSISIKSLKDEIQKQKWRIPLLACINLMATFLLISAIRLAPVTQVQPILSSNTITIALAGIIFLKEHDRLWLKLAAASLAALGLVLIGN